MNISQTLAAGQYAAARPATAPQPGTGGNLIAQAASDFADTLAAGENAALAAMRGADDPNALVTALAQTELAVETAVTIRNRVVEAYQEILRMPV
ncbi:MAG: flagellar hook-basal body complex protein FliE [Rubellimicrobium sp.]|nr:flagellar hook-basal body complex protein FliE [Rubellimicrobium sp.]